MLKEMFSGHKRRAVKQALRRPEFALAHVSALASRQKTLRIKRKKMCATTELFGGVAGDPLNSPDPQVTF